MAYSDFKLMDKIKQKFFVAFSSNHSFFRSVPAIDYDEYLVDDVDKILAIFQHIFATFGYLAKTLQGT